MGAPRSASRRRQWQAVLALLSLALLPGCEQPPQHLLVVTIDTLRADRLGAYGYDRPTSPCFDRLARQGVRFEDAVAQAISTPPSHASIFTGLSPPHHGLRRLWGQALAEEKVTLADILSGEGFTTAAFVSGLPLHEASGLGQGFDHFDDQFTGPERTAEQTNLRIESWLAERPPARLFLWVHYFDPHYPYVADERARSLFAGAREAPEWLSERNANPITGRPGVKPYDAEQRALGSSLYDAEVSCSDRALGRLLDLFEKEGLIDDTLIVVVSDHGECLGERGYFFGHWDVFAPTARVPMLLVHPDRRWRGEVVEETVRTVDLMPTILSLLGLPAPPGLDGSSLVPLLNGDGGRARLAYTEQLEYFPVRSLRMGSWLLVERGLGEKRRRTWFVRDRAAPEPRPVALPEDAVRAAFERRLEELEAAADSVPTEGVGVFARAEAHLGTGEKSA